MITYPASHMNRIMQCFGSTVMDAQRISPPSSTSKEEGEAAHYLANVVFNNQFQIEEMIDRKAPNGFYITADMADYVAQYVNGIYMGNAQFNEIDVQTEILGNGWRIAGKADHIAHIGQTLYVDGFHYGFRIVPAEENWTLIAHAIAFCIKYQIAPESVVLTIHQPRAFRPASIPAEWSISYSDLLKRYAQIQEQLSKTQARCHTGPACVTCDFAHACPAFNSAAHNAIDASEIAVPQEPTGDELSALLVIMETAKAHLDARLKSLQELAKHRIELGQIVPDYSLEPSQGSLKWNPGLNAEMLQMLIGHKVSRPGMITPSQAKKQFSLSDALLNSVAKRETTAPKLTRISADTKAKRIFAKGKPQT